MKRIIVFTTAFEPFVGGAEIAAKEIAKRLTSKYLFSVLTYRFTAELPEYEEKDGIRIYRWGFGGKLDRFFLFPFWTFFKGLSLMKEDQVLLWGIMVTYASIGAYFIKLLRPRVPFLLTLQEGDSPRHLKYGKAGMLGFWWKRLLKRADHIQTISKYLADYARERGARGKIAVVPNGVDMQLFAKTADLYELRRYRELYRLGPQDTVIIATSRLVKKNGVDTIISSLSSLGEEYKLIIAGEGEEEQNLRRMVVQKNLERRVTFTGTLSHADMAIYLRMANVFVRPSRSEGLGNSFLEAMAAGVPIIGTPVGGIPEFLTDNETGLFCKPDDPKDLADKIKKLATTPGLAERIGKQGCAYVSNRYSWDNIAAQMDGIYEGLTR